MVERIRQLWNGEVALGTAFWTYAVALGLGVNGVCTIGALALAVFDAPPAAMIAVFVLAIPYNVLITVGVWRSAESYEGEKKWADLARAATVIWAVVLTLF